MSFDEWMRLDLRYVDGWNLRLDLDLILRTFRVVLAGRESSWGGMARVWTSCCSRGLATDVPRRPGAVGGADLSTSAYAVATVKTRAQVPKPRSP